MHDAGDCYEFVCVYVDNLMAILKDPYAFFKSLVDDHDYKLKGVGPPEYHLSGNLFHDANGEIRPILRNYSRIMN